MAIGMDWEFLKGHEDGPSGMCRVGEHQGAGPYCSVCRGHVGKVLEIHESDLLNIRASFDKMTKGRVGKLGGFVRDVAAFWGFFYAIEHLFTG